jgi:hypothetical protein
MKCGTLSKKTQKLWIGKATYVDSKGKARLLDMVTGHRDSANLWASDEQAV